MHEIRARMLVFLHADQTSEPRISVNTPAAPAAKQPAAKDMAGSTVAAQATQQPAGSLQRRQGRRD